MTMKTAGLFLLPLLLLLPANSVCAASLQGADSGWTDVPDFRSSYGAATAFDWHRNKLVRFGGGRTSLYQQPGKQRFHRNDTWEWNGGKWEPRKPLHRPAPRSMHGMAYDPISKRVILFGGSDLQQIFGDTWAWDGQDWTRLSPKISPVARLGVFMGTDPVRGRIVLFGGGVGWKWGAVTPQSDTWEWDGKNWILMKPTMIPPPMALGRMAYSPASKAMVMSGSMTWEWNGKNWMSFNGNPGAGWGASLVTDWRTGRALSFSVTGQPAILHTSYWNGKSWQAGSVNYNLPFVYPIMASDPRSKLLVLVCQGDLKSSTKFRQRDISTWTFGGKSWKLVDHWKTYNAPDHIVHDPVRDEFLLMTDSVSDMPNLIGWRIKGARIEPLQSKTKLPFAPRSYALIYHPGLKKVWAFGGQLTRYTWSQDIWTWNGKDWAKLITKNPPPIKWGDPVVKQALYYPPHDSVLVTMHDKTLWEWSLAAGWKKLAMRIPLQTQSSNYSIDYAMAYDAARKVIVLWGGDMRYTTNVMQTWEWDGKLWSEVKTKTKPPLRTGPHLEYVSSMQGVMMFGGGGGSLYKTDAWFYDGKDWSKITDKAFAVDSWNSFAAGSAYDPGRQRIRVFQSFISSVSRMSEFRLPTLRASQPYPRPGQVTQLKTSLPRMAGAPLLYALAWSDRPGIPLRNVPGLGTELLPLAPDALLVMSLQMGLVTVLDTKGQASMPMGIPAQASMIGLRFHAAAVAFTKTLSVGAITNDVAIEVVK